VKRTILVFMFAICAITLVSAQGGDRQRRDLSQRGGPAGERGLREFRGERPPHAHWEGAYRPARPAAESVSINGDLTIAQGMIAVRYNNITYLVMGLGRFAGFIEGFREGAHISLKGYAISRPHDADTKIMRPVRMTFNGQEYDLVRPGREIPPHIRQHIRERLHSHPRFQARS